MWVPEEKLSLGSAHVLPLSGCTASDFAKPSPAATMVFLKVQCGYFLPLLKTFQWLPSAYWLKSMKFSLTQLPACILRSSCLSPLVPPPYSICPLCAHPASCSLLLCTYLPSFFCTYHVVWVPGPVICSSVFG